MTKVEQFAGYCLGLRCSPDDVPAAFPRLEELSQFPDSDDVAFDLWVNELPESKVAIQLLREAGISFRTKLTSYKTYRELDREWPFPFLRSTKDNKEIYPSLMHVKNLCRSRLLEKLGSQFDPFERTRELCKDVYWSEGKQYGYKVICLDESDQVVAKSKIGVAAYSVTWMLQQLPIVQRGTSVDHAYQDLLVWFIGDLSELKSELTETGHLIIEKLGVVLFADELLAFSRGVNHLVVDRTEVWVGCIYDWVDAYFYESDCLYRLFGRYVD
jgi:hypothetical protein